MTLETLIFAGGGTGGHVFPMIAVADAVRAHCRGVRIVFAGTSRGLESSLVPSRGYELELLDVGPMRGGGAVGAVRGALKAAEAAFAARSLLRKHAPRAVFSIGGYAAGPTTLSARTLGIPVALMEPNSAIGLANRLIAPLVQRAYTAFPESERHFRRAAVLRTGVPLRAGFEPRPYERAEESLRVLVLGGSQGAQSLNETVPRALSRARSSVRVVHQAGRAHGDAVRALYRELDMDSRVRVVPFIDDMPAALAEADLVVGRAGAGAVAEICAVGRPSLLIPYPHAGDHQKHNAASLLAHGAASMILAADATVERIASELTRLAEEPSVLSDMAARARSLGRPNAANVIARDLLSLAGLVAEVGGDHSTPPRSNGDPDGFALQGGR